MDTLIIVILSALGFLLAYHTYGRFLSRRIFGLNANAVVPSHELEDGIDYVPTRREVIFGHHFTSIAGTGPIVGPAIAVFWGWLPALLWVLLGSIFIGAVHDFGALVVSLRSRGQSLGDVAGRMISARARALFFLILFFVLTVVIGIFGLVIALLFSIYPGTVLPVWIAMPVAVVFGLALHRKGAGLAIPSLLALAALLAAVYLGVYHFPFSLNEIFGIPRFPAADAGFLGGLYSEVAIWTGFLLLYCFIASILPVWVLLQPRDYINSILLVIALLLLFLGIVVAHPTLAAPAINPTPPADAPPIFPFLFITVACGAVSGFHCLVSSGTTAKQLASESDAQYVGYGSMLVEALLAVFVIAACCAGLGMGVTTGEATVTGASAWQSYYGGEWAGMSLGRKVGAFVEGGGNMIAALGLPRPLAVGIIAVMVSCFAATTLDTATRLQRYVIQELSAVTRIPLLGNKYLATFIAVAAGGALALLPGPNGPGSGGLILWPLFGATNQLLAGLAFLVVAFYLVRHSKPVWFLAAPVAIMLIMPAWAMITKIHDWYAAGKWLLVGFGIAIEALQVWMFVEAAMLWRGARGVLPKPLPPLAKTRAPASTAAEQQGAE